MLHIAWSRIALDYKFAIVELLSAKAKLSSQTCQVPRAIAVVQKTPLKSDCRPSDAVGLF